MRPRNSDSECGPFDIRRAVELGALDPCAPLLSAVRVLPRAAIHYRPKGHGESLCGAYRCRDWPVARRSRTLDDVVCNECRARASRLRSFVRWAGIPWPTFPEAKRAASW